MSKKAIILVAGMGTRLKPLTLTTHKCLTKVNGIAILHNSLQRLKTIGVMEVVLVVGYLGEEIKRDIGTEYNGMKILYVENEQFTNTNTSYSLVKGLDALKEYDELFILEGDVFFEESLLTKIDGDEHNNTTLVETYDPRLDGTFVEIGEDGFIKDWTHKSMREEGYTLEDKYKTINIHKFSKGFVDYTLYPAAKKVCDDTYGKAPLENIMRDIVRDDGSIIYGLLSNGSKWFEIDDENDLNIAEEIFKDA